MTVWWFGYELLRDPDPDLTLSRNGFFSFLKAILAFRDPDPDSESTKDLKLQEKHPIHPKKTSS